MKLIRKTTSICPKCIKKIEANIVEENNGIFMVKKCKKDGIFKIKLFNDINYYKETSEFYSAFDIRKGKGFMPKKQEYYNIFLTMKCNLNCPICHVNANTPIYGEPSIKFIKNKLNTIKNTKIGLFGGESTLRQDLIDIIKVVKKTSNIPLLHTNGIKISNYNYLKKIKKAGISEVHLQFDGLDNNSYKLIRGEKLRDIKIKTLENLKRLKIPTVIQFTVVKGLNEKDMQPILEYALKNNFIKAIIYKSYSHLGKAGLDLRSTITIDQQIENIKDINKWELIEFQKILYLFWNLLSFPRCFYNHYFLLFRYKNKVLKISEMIDLKKIRTKLKRLKNLKKEKSPLFYPLLFSLIPNLINSKSIRVLCKSAIIFLRRKLLKKYFVFGENTNNMLIIEFGSICDMYNFDFESAKNCDGGEITTEGINNSLAYGNILREKIKKCNLNKNNYRN